MDQTCFRLLARDGAFTVIFVPALSAEQYAELREVVSRDLRSKAEYRQLCQTLAQRWGVRFESDLEFD
jgi:hypothetical protein